MIKKFELFEPMYRQKSKNKKLKTSDFDMPNFKPIIGHEINNNIETFIIYVKNELNYLLDRKISFTHDNENVVITPKHTDVKIHYIPHHDYIERIKYGKPVYTNKIEDIVILITDGFKLYYYDYEANNGKIKIIEKEQIFSEIDPLGEEIW